MPQFHLCARLAPSFLPTPNPALPESCLRHLYEITIRPKLFRQDNARHLIVRFFVTWLMYVIAKVFKSFSSFCRSNGRIQGLSVSSAVVRRLFPANVQNEGLSPQFSKREHVVSPRRGVLYRYTYYAVNMYNEIRERRMKKREGDCKGRREEVEGMVEEVEEEGRQTILAKDRRYSNAIVAVAAACTAKHFYRLPWLQDNHHFFPPSQVPRIPAYLKSPYSGYHNRYDINNANVASTSSSDKGSSILPASLVVFFSYKRCMSGATHESVVHSRVKAKL
ncbi:hypothetical protein G5I_13463 [Acromyrmex echinatior]|uniref:Uncharacterized protein n=1 Tax=Acromyrmex echinatior TaxID=103372 RepID=F4X552_ACREC|nr:hypothetical protein G5I_13463 [Acromyrmex echinatior]